MNKSLKLKYFIIILLVGAGWFYYTNTGVKPGLNVEKMEPRELVQTYYDSISSGDQATARTCLDPSYLRQVSSCADWDVKNIKTLGNLTLSKPVPAQLPKVEGETVQLIAGYDVKYKKEITECDGHSIRFIYVNSKDNGPWKIVSIGTGP